MISSAEFDAYPDFAPTAHFSARPTPAASASEIIASNSARPFNSAA